MGVTPSPSPVRRPPWRVLRFLALRLADAVAYAMCAALLLLNAGTVLSVLAGRVGGGARLMSDAAGLAAIAGACLFPFYIVGMPLVAWRCTAAEAAKRSSSKQAPPADRKSKGSSPSVLGDLWAGTPARWRVLYMFFLPVLAGQLIKCAHPWRDRSRRNLPHFCGILASSGWRSSRAAGLLQGWLQNGRQLSRRVPSLYKSELPV